MTRIRIMCDRTDGTTIKLGDIETDKTDTTSSICPDCQELEKDW